MFANLSANFRAGEALERLRSDDERACKVHQRLAELRGGRPQWMGVSQPGAKVPKDPSTFQADGRTFNFLASLLGPYES